jgi:hypothetical protein
MPVQKKLTKNKHLVTHENEIRRAGVHGMFDFGVQSNLAMLMFESG